MKQTAFGPDFILDCARLSGYYPWSADLTENTICLSGELEELTGQKSGAGFPGGRGNVYFEDAPRLESRLRALISGELSSYREIYRLLCGGELVWIEESCFVHERCGDGSPRIIGGLMRSVSDEQNKIRSLETKERCRRYIAYHAGLGGWELDARTWQVTFDDDYSELLGYRSGQMNGRLDEVCQRLVHPEDAVRVRTRIESCIKSIGEHSFKIDFRIRRSDGSYIWVQDTGAATGYDAGGRAVTLTGAVLNIDARVRAERKTRESLEEIERLNNGLVSEVEKAVEELAAELETNTAMFSSNPNPSLLFDGGGNVIDCNPAAVDVFGFDCKEDLLLGLDERSRSWVKDGVCSGRSISERLAVLFAEDIGQGTLVFETEIFTEDELHVFDVKCRKIPYKGGDAYVAYLTDVSERYRAQRETEYQDTLISTINEVAAELLSTDGEAFSACVGRAMYRIGKAVGVDRIHVWKNVEREGELFFRRILVWDRDKSVTYDLTHEERYADLGNIMDYLSERRVVRGRVSTLPPEDRAVLEAQKVRSLVTVPLCDRDRLWGFVSYHDCVEDREFTDAEETALQSAGNIIASAILKNDLLESLVKATREAVHSARAKSDFLSRMSHEIRTPMNAIIGMTSLAAKSDELEKIRGYLKKAESSSQQLLGIINDVLDMSKIDADKLEISENEFELGAMLRHVIDVSNVRLEEKHQSFICEIDSRISRKLISDELRLSQVVLNLISNAVKFTPEYGSITLGVTAKDMSERGAVLRVEVRDTGIGISEAGMKKLFQTFEQVEGGIQRQFGGTGLGLAISKRLINLLGGEIWAESVQGEGSSFIFEVPVLWGGELEETGSRAKATDETAPDWRGKTLLLAEDIEINREIFIALLEETGVEIEIAENGEQAVMLFTENSHKYSAIMMDIQMPKLDGLSAARMIREIGSARARDIPIIAMTANAFKEDERASVEAGMNGHIAKPIEQSVVFSVLSRYLG